jgi:hypothetical protein
MATESNIQSSQGVRTYRGRTLEEILPQIREELGPDAIILREREGLVGGVGGFFAQRFTEVEARRGDDAGDRPGTGERLGAGPSIDIYDDGDDDFGFDPPALASDIGSERALLGPGDLGGGDAPTAGLDIGVRRQTPIEEPARSEPKSFVPPELQRERIIPRDPQGEPAPPTRRFETDVFLERLREASQMLPDEDEQLDGPATAAPLAPPRAPMAEPEPEAPPAAELEDPETEPKPGRPARRTPPERKPRSPQPRRPRPEPRTKAAPKGPAAKGPVAKGPAAMGPLGKGPGQAELQPAPVPVDPWTAAMAALVAESEPEQIASPRFRQRPPSLRMGLPTESPAAPAGLSAPSATSAQRGAPVPPSMPIAPLEIRARRDGVLRGVISRLLGGRFGAQTLPKPSPPRPIDAAAASAITAELSARGAGQPWTAQLISTAGAHGTPLSGSLLAAAEAELARRIVPAPTLPATGAAVAFIGAGGAGKTRCTAALASAYSRASTLGVTVIAVDNPSGARELKRLLDGDGVPVLSLSGERARQAVAAYREAGFVIVDTPTTTPTDPTALEALGASLAPLELDATFVTLPATLGPQAARRALAGFGRLNPTAVAITHADETDQLAVVVEIAIANRIPLAYFHAGTDHRSAMSSVEAGALAQQLLAS